MARLATGMQIADAGKARATCSLSINREQAMGKFSKASIKSTRRGYYHDLDPYTMHATQAAAKSARSGMKNTIPGIVSRNPRVSTFYTILQDKRKNDPQKFGNVPQGPHTFPHHGIHQGLAEARKQNKLDAFAPLISSPSLYDSRVDHEIPGHHPKFKRAKIAKVIFKKRYQRFADLKKLGAGRSEHDNIRYAHVMNKLLQQDPFGSYAYKGAGAGKAALKGKGENADKPLSQQIDLPSKHGINDVAGVTTRNKTLLASLGAFGFK